MTAPYITSFPEPEYVHQSTLKKIATSPAHLKEHLEKPDWKDTPAMRFGRVVHAMLFEFGLEYVKVWKGPRTGNAWKDFKAEHDDLNDIVTEEEAALAAACAAAIRFDKVAGPLLHGASFEEEFSWTFAGRKCAGRIDVCGRQHVSPYFAEVKTAPSSKPSWFMRHGLKLNYLEQAAFYDEGLRQNDIEIERAFMIVVEKKAPHPVVVLDLMGKPLDYGARNMRLWMERRIQCEAANDWPAYAQSVIPYEVPDETPDLDFSDMEEGEDNG